MRGHRSAGGGLVPVQVEQVAVKVVGDVPLRPGVARALPAGGHGASRQAPQRVVGKSLGPGRV